MPSLQTSVSSETALALLLATGKRYSLLPYQSIARPRNALCMVENLQPIHGVPRCYPEICRFPLLRINCGNHSSKHSVHSFFNYPHKIPLPIQRSVRCFFFLLSSNVIKLHDLKNVRFSFAVFFICVTLNQLLKYLTTVDSVTYTIVSWQLFLHPE